MTAPPPGQWGPGAQPPVPPQQPPPGYYPQPGPWSGPPQPPPKQNNTVKWMLGGVGILLIIAITVGITVLVTRDDTNRDGGPTTTPTGEPIASADDDGPIEIITLEPTCQAWMPVSRTLSQIQRNGWDRRDPQVPAVDWSSAERSQFEAVGKAMSQSAEQAVGLARQTPHRVIRELYEQFIAFARAYNDSIPDYEAPDEDLALGVVAATMTIDSVCDAITYGSAPLRSAIVTAAPDPSAKSPTLDPADSERLQPESAAGCERLTGLGDQLVRDFEEWSKQDPRIPGSEWTSQQRSAAERAADVLSEFAREVRSVGEDSTEGAFQDLAYFSSVYSGAYAEALSDYQPADNFLLVAGTRANNILISACEAKGR